MDKKPSLTIETVKDWGPSFIVVICTVVNFTANWTRVTDLIPIVKDTAEKVVTLQKDMAVTMVDVNAISSRVERLEKKIDRGFK